MPLDLFLRVRPAVWAPRRRECSLRSEGALHLSEGGPGLYRPGDGVQIGVHDAVLVKAKMRCLLPVPPFVGQHAVQDRAMTPSLLQDGSLDFL
jgi:hypothetical protein